MIIGDRLRALREEKKLSQGDIEKRTGLLVVTFPASRMACVLTIVRSDRVGTLDGPRVFFYDDGRMAILDAGNVTTKQPVRFSISPWESFFSSRSARRRSPIIMRYYGI